MELGVPLTITIKDSSHMYRNWSTVRMTGEDGYHHKIRQLDLHDEEVLCFELVQAKEVGDVSLEP